MSEKDTDLYVLKESTNMVETLFGGARSETFSDTAAPTTTGVFSGIENGTEIQKWGASNNLPQENRIKLEKSTTALPLIVKWAEIVFGRGLFYFQESRVNGRIRMDFNSILEIDEFILRNNIDYIALERIMDYKTHGNLFLELAPAKDGKKISRVNHLEAEFSRFIVKESKITDIAYKANWLESAAPTTIPFLNSSQKRDKEVLDSLIKKKKNFAIHSCFPSPGHSLYAVPAHNAIFEPDGWLDYALSIPKIMNNINKTAGNIKYHIRIPKTYWVENVKGWESLNNEQRDAIIDAKIKEMDEWFKGILSKGSTVYTHYNVEATTGKPLAGWEIIALADQDKKDKYLTSVQEADIQTARALSIDTSISGIQATGGKLGAGSGTDKEAGFSQAVFMSHAASMVILDFMYVVAIANNWPSNVKFGFLDAKTFQESLLNESKTTEQ